jgi:anti-sigma regulatory factor (Ser/Thr protein kinase)
MDRLDFQLPAGPRAAHDARHEILGANGSIPELARQDILLLVTELVTNAVRHGADGASEQLGVQVLICPERLRVEVRDRGDGFEPHQADSARGDHGGWGLVLVEELSDRWGVLRDGDGTVVWFEYRLRA